MSPMSEMDAWMAFTGLARLNRPHDDGMRDEFLAFFRREAERRRAEIAESVRKSDNVIPLRARQTQKAES